MNSSEPSFPTIQELRKFEAEFVQSTNDALHRQSSSDDCTDTQSVKLAIAQFSLTSLFIVLTELAFASMIVQRSLQDNTFSIATRVLAIGGVSFLGSCLGLVLGLVFRKSYSVVAGPVIGTLIGAFGGVLVCVPWTSMITTICVGSVAMTLLVCLLARYRTNEDD